MKKKIFLTLTTAFILAFSLFPAASAQNITITVNGNVVETDTAPIIVNERTMVPLRAISTALNCGVAYQPETRGVSILQSSVDGSKAFLAVCWIGKDHAFVIDGTALTNTCVMDVPPMIENDRTLVPVRAISELLGAKVDWDGESQTVLITAELPDLTELDAEARKQYDMSATEYLSEFAQSTVANYETELFKQYDAYAAYADGQSKTVKVEIGLHNGGVITAELYSDLAPLSVENFVRLAKEQKFDNTIFHRVIKNFMIQGGAFEESGTQRQSDSIKGEFLTNGVFNILPHKRGILSMARGNNPDSASNQFFIVHADSPHLNGNYAAFGMVTSGMEYVDEIANVTTDEDDKPTENQPISYIKILE